MSALLSFARNSSRSIFTKSVLLLLGCVLVSSSALADLTNISTRAYIETGDRIAIGGFVISEADPDNPDNKQCVVVRARGQSVNLTAGKLPDPILTIKQGSVTLEENDDWQDHQYSFAIEELNLAGNLVDSDAAIYICLDPGAYTALVRDSLDQSGIGIVEVVTAPYYDVGTILAVKLWPDIDNVLVGDYLDNADLPTLGGSSTFDDGNNTLNISVGSATDAAVWNAIFTAGRKYQITAEATGVTSLLRIKSGGNILRTINQNGNFSFIGAVAGDDLTISTEGSSSSAVSLTVNDVVTLSWNVNNADSCNTTGDDADWRAFEIIPGADRKDSGSLELPVLVNSEQTINYGLVCDNGPQSVSDLVTIAASSCLTAGAVDIIDWTDLPFSIGSVEWPRPTGNFATISIDQNTTKSIKFNTITADPGDIEGQIKNPQVNGVPGRRQISISRCPGQFEGLPPRCQRDEFTTSGVIYWELDNLAGNSSTCKLDRDPDGATYYFNIRFMDSCGSASCFTRVQP